MPRRARRLLFTVVALLAVAGAATPAIATAATAEANGTSPGERFVGMPLAAALQVLQRQGVAVVFSTAVVLPTMVVRDAPRATAPAAMLDELLRPHGLAASHGPRGRLIVVRTAPPPAQARQPMPAAPQPLAAEIEVTAPAESLHGEPVAAAVLALPPPERDLPHAGSDVFRAVGLLPGAATSESSAQLSVRGGRRDDVMVVLDGLELLAPYHLQEFDAALGIVPAVSLEHVELIADPLPVEYGDRLGGVVDMRTRTPGTSLHGSFGVGSLFADTSAGSAFAGDRGRWLAAARSGNYRLALEAGGRHEDPRYWDVFAKTDYALRPGQDLQLRVLLASDDFEVRPGSVGGGSYHSRWSNSYLWASHVGALGTQGLAESMAWVGLLERKRFADQAQQGALRFDLDDRRTSVFAGAKSTWRWGPSTARWSLDGGAEWRQIDSSIRYRADRVELAPELPGTAPAGGSTRVKDDFEFEQVSAFASGRLRTGRNVTLEGGLRWDHTGPTDEQHVSPRLHLAWSPDAATVVHAGWGWYYQSQRPYEVQVEDGQTAVLPSQRATQSLLSYERRLAGGASWRLGAYERREDTPRERFESLFDTAVLYPELAPGRVRLDPDLARARGLELLYRAAPRQRLDWSAAYTLATVEDRIDGRWVPRATDETHALELQARLQLPHDFTLGAVWLYHTGWPTTGVGARVVRDGLGIARVEPVLGPIRDERLPDYHRLDLRLGRSWPLRGGRLGAFLDLQNVYARHNVRGYDGFRFALGSGGEPEVFADSVSWGGFLPSFGVRWSR
ncbi:MAG TPA: TonB-dependent receptor [Thermoanaerobaculia bacterium]|nr:TonB-dependent receptor [Thermoanaerobaculia bacterium]